MFIYEVASPVPLLLLIILVYVVRPAQNRFSLDARRVGSSVLSCPMVGAVAPVLSCPMAERSGGAVVKP